MFRNSRFGGWIAVILVLALIAVIGFAAFQIGVAQGAGGAVLPHGMQEGYRTVTFIPFFWGFGLLRFGLGLLFVLLILRFLFAPWRRMRSGGPWHHDRREEWRSRLKDMHDSWHAENPAPDEPPAAAE